jgi:hypothetical protein
MYRIDHDVRLYRIPTPHHCRHLMPPPVDTSLYLQCAQDTSSTCRTCKHYYRFANNPSMTPHIILTSEQKKMSDRGRNFFPLFPDLHRLQNTSTSLPRFFDPRLYYHHNLAAISSPSWPTSLRLISSSCYRQVGPSAHTLSGELGHICDPRLVHDA